ncbi:UNVERIFIED_CONTAM: hypothetical protein RMT77_003742 [Armadillidium vulgare]
MTTFESFDLLNVIECKQGAVRAVRFNVDGGYCLTCGSDKSLKLWNPHKGTLIHTYTGHGYEVLDAKSSCDNSLIVSCGLDKSVMVWNVSTGEAMRKFRGHAARVNSVTMNEESTVALSSSVDGSVRIWDLRSRSKEPIQILEEAKDSVTSVSVSGHEILTSSLDCYSRVYDIRNGKLTSNCIGESLTFSSFSEDSQCILIASINSGLKLMDKENGELLAEFSGHNTTDVKVECCFLNTATHVVSGSEDGFAYCWDIISGKITNRFEHKGSRIVHSLSPHPSETKLLTASLGQIWFWGQNSSNESNDGNS